MTTSTEHWTYQLRYVRCGKPTCRCARGSVYEHGPYWYGYMHREGRMYQRYFGRRPSSTFDPPPPEARAEATRAEADSRFTFSGKMTLASALRIFAVSNPPGRDELVSRWRRLIWDHHPDRGGSTAVAAAINAAYTF